MLAEAATSVLVVDDELGVRDLLTRWLETTGVSVTTAGNAEEALGHLASLTPAVAVCDIRMPGRDGLWLAARIRQQCPETAVIMATGVQDIGPAIQSLRQGVIDYLTKPFGRARLQEAVSRGIEWHRAACDARRWRETLEEELYRRWERLAVAIARLRVDSDESIDAMLSIVTLDDRDAYQHAHRVAATATRIGRAFGMEDAALKTLGRAALLHDVGKLVLPDAILKKPAPLTPDERALVRRHPQIGSDLIAGVPSLSAAAAIVAEVHERVDGYGYPRGIGADALSLSARIIAVADAFDTMTHPRVFRDALSAGEALLELERCSHAQFDAEVVDRFRRLDD